MTPIKIFDATNDIDSFSTNMKKNFNISAGKGGWKGNDKWWYLAQLASAVNLLEKELLNNKKDLVKETCNIATLALIIEDLQKAELSVKTTKKKKKVVARK